MPVESRRNYTGLFDATRRILAENGFSSLFNGAFLPYLRSVSFNVGMFATFEQFKEVLNKAYPENPNYNQFAACVFGGTAAALVSLPFDTAINKIQILS